MCRGVLRESSCEGQGCATLAPWHVRPRTRGWGERSLDGAALPRARTLSRTCHWGIQSAPPRAACQGAGTPVRPGHKQR
eukprot:835744-Alexandrium_andersonii.AAC.1